MIRINKFVARATGMSRRAADTLIQQGQVRVNSMPAHTGQEVTTEDTVTLQSKRLVVPEARTIMLHKPVGYVVSRLGQGSKTIYNLLPAELHALKPVGRLDKNSSGLLLLTDDGALAQQLTHPKYHKTKVYEIRLNKNLLPAHQALVQDKGVELEDGPSKLQLTRQKAGNDRAWVIYMHEGRNRQIRRTFAALGYSVPTLHRTKFGDYTLPDIPAGAYRTVS